MKNINSFHPDIKFTTTTSSSSIDFLDLTIYKSEDTTPHMLNIKTYQKSNNLYQYLEFSSGHPRSIYKSIVTGECIRYLRTNTNENNFKCQTELFKAYLRIRNYPINFKVKQTRKITFKNRDRFISRQLQPPLIITRPIMKCIPPPNFSQLKQINNPE